MIRLASSKAVTEVYGSNYYNTLETERVRGMSEPATPYFCSPPSMEFRVVMCLCTVHKVPYAVNTVYQMYPYVQSLPAHSKYFHLGG